MFESVLYKNIFYTILVIMDAYVSLHNVLMHASMHLELPGPIHIYGISRGGRNETSTICSDGVKLLPSFSYSPP